MALVAPDTSVQGPAPPVKLYCHWYVMPVPVAGVVSVKASGSPPEQMVLLPLMAPAVTLFAVTVIQLPLTEQDIPFKVEVTILL